MRPSPGTSFPSAERFIRLPYPVPSVGLARPALANAALPTWRNSTLKPISPFRRGKPPLCPTRRRAESLHRVWFREGVCNRRLQRHPGKKLSILVRIAIGENVRREISWRLVTSAGPTQEMYTASPETPIIRLSNSVGREWPALERAQREATRVKADFAALIADGVPQEDASVVVFGSLARDEFTSGSDVDWALLIDGQASSTHLDTALEIERRLAGLGRQGPGRENTFGGLAVSHELLHRIGGAEDTNRNLTQRVLLLLESEAIGPAAAYQRVVTGVLDRYITEDPGWNDRTVNVPRFLLNDIARYWRTVAVDFAYKRRLRGSQGWALRTVKLRLSRKLTYASGLLACFSCALIPSLADANDRSKAVLDHLENLVRLTPLELVAKVLSDEGLYDPAGQLFDTYEQFLLMLDDAATRRKLHSLKREDASSDDTYKQARAISHRFQAALNAIFFESGPSEIPALTKRYAVF